MIIVFVSEHAMLFILIISLLFVNWSISPFISHSFLPSLSTTLSASPSLSPVIMTTNAPFPYILFPVFTAITSTILHFANVSHSTVSSYPTIPPNQHILILSHYNLYKHCLFFIKTLVVIILINLNYDLLVIVLTCLRCIRFRVACILLSTSIVSVITFFFIIDAIFAC